MEAACSSETLVCCTFFLFFHVNSRPPSFDNFNFEDGSVILLRNVGTPLLGCSVTMTSPYLCISKATRNIYVVYLSQYLTNLMHKICFTVNFISCLYMFRAHVLIIRRSKLHYTASGIITHIGGRLVHGLREDCSTCARNM